MSRPILTYTLLGIFWLSSLTAGLSEEICLKRLNAHLTVQDYPSAVLEVEEALEAHSESQPLHEAYIQALARSGDEKKCFQAWVFYAHRFGIVEPPNNLVEEMAWGVITKAANSPSPPIRLMALLAATMSQDAKGVLLIKKMFSDTNFTIRAAAVKLASSLRDEVLKIRIEEMLRNEECHRVRIEAIKAVGAMNIKSARSYLLALLNHPSTHAQEKAAAIHALVQMQEKIGRKAIARLVESKRSAMRLLACQMVLHQELEEEADLLLPLLNDASPDVRANVLYTIGSLRVPIDKERGLVVNLMSDPNPLVAMTAAWAMTLAHPDIGMSALEGFLNDQEEEIRRLASGALACTGAYGAPLIEKAFFSTTDPYVKLNLAQGLIGRNAHLSHAAECIYSSLINHKEQWMLNEDSFFPHVVPTKLKHDELVKNYPEAVNQVTRLQFFNQLAIMKYPHAKEAIKNFLLEKKWGISGMASAVLLTECDDQAKSLVLALLQDPDQKIKLQVALILSYWGAGEEALSVLEGEYKNSNFEDKEKILEGITRVGSKSSIPFLIQRLSEPHQSLRIIAALGILQAIYQ